MKLQVPFFILALAGITLVLAACSSDKQAAPAGPQAAAPTATNSPPVTTAERKAGNAQSQGNAGDGLLVIDDDVAAKDRGSRLLHNASRYMASARGTMSIYDRMISQHGTDAIKQQFAPVKKNYDEGMKQANALMFKIAASDDQTLPVLVTQYNENWQKVGTALAKAKALQLKALTAKPGSSK